MTASSGDAVRVVVAVDSAIRGMDCTQPTCGFPDVDLSWAG